MSVQPDSAATALAHKVLLALAAAVHESGCAAARNRPTSDLCEHIGEGDINQSSHSKHAGWMSCIESVRVLALDFCALSVLEDCVEADWSCRMWRVLSCASLKPATC